MAAGMGCCAPAFLPSGELCVDRKKTAQDLGRRERQIMDAIFQLGEASVSDVRRSLSDPPSYSAVRTMIGSLEQKGLLKHRRVGIKYVYRPTQSPAAASRSALKHLLRTFYSDSPAEAVATILEVASGQLTAAELKKIESLIEQARKESP
jgi:BlaI family transcriptional regulator, penicillinase repressor